MAKIEVEHRGLLSEAKFHELLNFFKTQAKFIGEKKRFSVINSNSISSVRESKDELIDLKLRITNKKPELVVKYGKWSGKDARKEYSFQLEEDKFEDMLELLHILGFQKFVLMANTKFDFLYHDIDFSLVQVPEWGYYFEAEILTDENSKEQADKRIETEIKNLGLKALDEEEFFNLLDDLNNRDGFRIDLNKTNFNDIKKRFLSYF